ncbi:hypothetical protein NQ315_006717 [Exocentrus adspersus]|uniref:Uncharacterized protein n=1 Tax=Exocentrus adspersus TaxID=1586481 RepID=A0AAV8WBI3_9CUCU|nr:hypothetical protein NQ315_006717 [Exocentrus adspersus]
MVCSQYIYKPYNSKLRQKETFQQKNKKERKSSSTVSKNFFVKSKNSGTSNESETYKSNSSKVNHELQSIKKPFDKKKYRLQKYSKKYKLEQWQEKRKKAVVRDYYKTLKKDVNTNGSTISKEHFDELVDGTESTDRGVLIDTNTTMSDIKSANSVAETENVTTRGIKEKKRKPFRKAYQVFEHINEEKEKRREVLLIKKREKEEALNAYKKKKAEKFKKLNKKTKKRPTNNER